MAGISRAAPVFSLPSDKFSWADTREEIVKARAQTEHLTELAEEAVSRGRVQQALFLAQVAATNAFLHHNGVFCNARLERLLTGIGAGPLPATAAERPLPGADGRRRVLHVLTYARPVGGDSRFVGRWIANDPASVHSIAITSQGQMELPASFAAAAEGSGGRLLRCDQPESGLLACASRLRSVAQQSDLVVLHLYPDDVCPLVAFGNKTGLPPVLFMNHADHTFWLGRTISDAIVHLREIGVSVSRRGLVSSRFAFLPIPLEVPPPLPDQADARRRVGLQADHVVLLTVATGFKYSAIESRGFLDIVTPILKRHRNFTLLAVGPSRNDAWARAATDTGGRIIPMGQMTPSCGLL